VTAVGPSGARANIFRARRPLRAVLLAVILSAAAALIWLPMLHQNGSSCPAPGSDAVAQGQRLPASGLDAVAPAPPQLVRVQVLNANGVLGEATIVDAELAQLGFASTTMPANDSQYPAFDMRCYGQIRFGAAGQTAARTLSLVVPCAELIRDIRPDSVVDLALGTRFTAVAPNDAARTALLTLAGLGQSAPDSTTRGGLATAGGPQPAVPVAHPDLLHSARQVKC
jgi:LytR cell envelope-related transcriptional attenuator